MIRKSTLTALAVLFALTASAPALASLCDFSEVAVFAINSAHVSKNASVTGDVVANSESPGPVLDAGAEVALDRGATVTGNVKGHTIDLDRQSTIDGDVTYVELFNGGTITGSETIGAPPYTDVPDFQPASPGGDDVFVGPGETVILTGASYGDILISAGGRVVFSGRGSFDVASIGPVAGGGQCPFPCRSVEFDAPTDLRVAGRIDSEKNTFVGASSGSAIGASDIVIYAGGTNGGAGGPLDTPFAVNIGSQSVVEANIYAPYGTIEIDKDSTATGAFLALDVEIQSGTLVIGDSAFLNQPPVADAESVTTDGLAVEITLTGSDPEGFDLFFGIVSDPTQGDLTGLMPIVPDEVPVLDRDGNPTGEVIQPPVTSATVVYTPTGCTPDGEGGLICPPDSFVFDVTDDCGAVAEAEVNINPNDPTPTPTPVDQVVANDVAAETTTGTTVTITLDAEAPGFCSMTTPPQACQDFEDSLDCPNGETCDPDPLTFEIISLPGDGALTDSGNNAIESAPAPLPDGTVNYTPGSGFVSGVCSVSTDDLCEVNADCLQGETCIQPDSFDYSATGDLGGTDSATVTVRVFAQVELATDQSVTTLKNTPTVVTLQGNSGGSGEPVPSPPLAQTRAPGAPLPGATIAGNVGDADGNGFGDGRDDLPGSAPVFISAAVDRNFSSASSSDEATFQAALAGGFTEYDFETASEFPAAPAVIGLFDGIDFQAQTFSGPATSGTQTMTGVGGTFTTATLDFTGLELQPNAFGFFALDLTVGEVVRVTVDYTNAVSEVFDVGLGGQPEFTEIYFGHYDTAKVIDKLSFRGTDTGGDDRAWLIDDLTVGRRSTVSGVTRIQIEWDISSLDIGAADEIESATVTLSTNKGSVDSLDTFFYVVTEDRDGELGVSDFESNASQLAGVVMPVPPVEIGTDGTFSFNVTNALKSAFDSGFSYFSIQGRVDEDLAGQGSLRGLQIRSTATGNLADGTEPQLEIVTEVPDAGIVLKVLSLPADNEGTPTGTLTDLSGFAVSVGQTFATTTSLLFTPQFGFSGTASFDYSATQAGLVDTAIVAILVGALDQCELVGRDPGCVPDGSAGITGPQQGAGQFEDSGDEGSAAQAGRIPNLRVAVEGAGAGTVTSSRRETAAGSFVGLSCDGKCGMDFADGTEVVLYARSIGDDSEFVRWGGDCSGSEPITKIVVWGKRQCTAEFTRK